MKKLIMIVAVMAALVFPVVASAATAPALAPTGTIEYQSNTWWHSQWSPDAVNYGSDSVSVDLSTDDLVNSNYDATGIRFLAVVSADQSGTRVSIERVALATPSRTLYIWSGERLGQNGIAKVGPSSPWKSPVSCYDRMRINFSVRWSNGQLTHHSWLTGWSKDYWVNGC